MARAATDGRNGARFIAALSICGLVLRPALPWGDAAMRRPSSGGAWRYPRLIPALLISLMALAALGAVFAGAHPGRSAAMTEGQSLAVVGGVVVPTADDETGSNLTMVGFGNESTVSETMSGVPSPQESCPNSYDAQILPTSVTLTYPGGYVFPASTNSAAISVPYDLRYVVSFTLHTPAQSAAGNSENGSAWYESDDSGSTVGYCVRGVGPNTEVYVVRSVPDPRNGTIYHQGQVWWSSGTGEGKVTVDVSWSKGIETMEVTPGRTGIIVPLYVAPGAVWTQLIQERREFPALPVVAVVDPDNGAGPRQYPGFVAGIEELQAAGITVIGYIDSGRATIPISEIEANITEYSQWYHLQGVFLDDMVNGAGYEDYYSQASYFAYSQGMEYTIANPGAPQAPTYYGTVNDLVISESGQPPPTILLDALAQGRTGLNSTTSFSFIATDVSSLPGQEYFDSIAPYVSWVWVTDQGNAYDSLPSYLAQEMAELAAAATASSSGSS